MRSDPESGPQPVALRWFALHVFALSGFALAQPVYSWMSAQATFLVAHGLDFGKAALIVAFLSLLLPALLALGVSIFSVFGRQGLRYAQIVLIALLAGVFGLHALPLQAVWPVVLFMFTVAGGLAYWRLPLFRQLLSGLALLALFLPVVFVLTEPVRGMLASQQAHARVLAGEQEPADAAGRPRENVLLVLLDEFPGSFLGDPENGIDADRFPGFARLAAASTWYPYASTVHRGTRHVVPALLTGRLPPDHSPLARWQDYPQSLFGWAVTVYGEAVYSHESFTRLCPPVVCAGGLPDPGLNVLIADVAVLTGHAAMPEELAARYLPPLADRWYGFAAEHAPILTAAMYRDRTLGWREFRSGLQPGFTFKHLMLPHAPLQYLPDGTTYPDVLQAYGYQRRENVPGLYVLSMQRRYAQARYTDRLLQELLDQLESEGLWEDTLLVVTADHGHSHRPGIDRRRLEPGNLGDVLNVPLFIKKPGQNEGSVDFYPASLLDIAPTVAGLMDKPLHWEADGVSLVSHERPQRNTLSFSCAGLFGCAGEIRRQAGSGSIVHLDVEDYRDRVRESVQWQAGQLYFDGSLGMKLPAGTGASLPGRELGELRIRERPGGSVRIFESDKYTKVDPGSGSLPALLGGVVEGPGMQPGEQLAVALNGRVAGLAVTSAVQDGDEILFGALLDSSAFIEGHNEVAVYRFKKSAETAVPWLVPLRILD